MNEILTRYMTTFIREKYSSFISYIRDEDNEDNNVAFIPINIWLK